MKCVKVIYLSYSFHIFSYLFHILGPMGPKGRARAQGPRIYFIIMSYLLHICLHHNRPKMDHRDTTKDPKWARNGSPWLATGPYSGKMEPRGSGSFLDTSWATGTAQKTQKDQKDPKYNSRSTASAAASSISIRGEHIFRLPYHYF